MENHYINIIAGGITGFTQVCWFPIDTLKIKKQTLNTHTETYTNIYRGIRFPLMTIQPITAIQFSMEDYLTLLNI